MKLFVDDARPVPPGWVLARTVDEALRLLDQDVYEEVSLDYVIMGGGTFFPVAQHLAGMESSRRPKKVRLHSSSPQGARLLYLTLQGSIPDLSIAPI